MSAVFQYSFREDPVYPGKLGRCVPATPPKTGEYKGLGLQVPEPKGKGAYKWIKGAGEKKQIHE